MKTFVFNALFLSLTMICVYPKIANAQTLTTFDMLLATRTLTVGNLNLLSFRTAGISSFTTAGISSFTVPSGVTSIFVKAWGAGGGGGGSSNCNTYRAGNGAGGSFASGLISVSSGEVLTVSVGFGGVSTGVFGGIAGLPGGQGLSSTAGGSGGNGGSGSGIGSAGNGGGGAASGVFRVTTSTVGLVVAGGGGAGGGYIYNVGPSGGSASAQGVGGAGNANGTAGASTGAGGGGGGGGATSGGTGGGDGLGGTTGDSIGTVIMYGSGMTAGNTSDVDYSSTYPSTGVPNGNETIGVGTGGQGGITSCYGENGNSGAVILYKVHAASAAVTVLGGLSIDSSGIQWADGTTSTTSSKIVQFVSSMTAAAMTTSTPIPDDDTLPQNTEGKQAVAVVITPQSSSNKLLIQAVANINNTANGFSAVLALFQDSGTNAIAAAMQNEGSSYRIQNVTLSYVMDAGTTSSTTFKLRFGASNANDTTINGDYTTRYLGGALKTTLTVTEFKP